MPSFRFVLEGAWTLSVVAVFWIAIRLGRKWSSQRKLSMCPELQGLEESERERVWTNAHDGSWWNGTAIFIAVGFVIYYTSRKFLPAFGVSGDLAIMTARGTMMAIFIVGGGAANDLLQRNLLRRSVRRELNQLGIPTCMSCGHDLRGTPANICGECGAIHVRDMCYRCEGVGHTSRRYLLWCGIAFLVGWAVLMVDALCSVPWPITGDVGSEFLFARLNFILPGAICSILYFWGGPTEKCCSCKGSANNSKQGQISEKA